MASWCSTKNLSFALRNLARGRLPRGWQLAEDDGYCVARTAGPVDGFFASLIRLDSGGLPVEVLRFDVPVAASGQQTVRMMEDRLRSVVESIELRDWGEAIQGAQ